MLKPKDIRELHTLRSLRKDWGALCIKRLTGRLCGVEYDIRSKEDLDELLEPFSDVEAANSPSTGKKLYY